MVGFEAIFGFLNAPIRNHIRKEILMKKIVEYEK